MTAVGGPPGAADRGAWAAPVPLGVPADGVFFGDGVMARMCRAHDWAATPLGPVAGWPQSLRTAAGLVMSSAFPTIVCWGPRLVQIYNDGYIEITQAKHPWALGRPTYEVWPEVWHLNEPLFRRAQAGETVHVEDAPYPLRRRGPDHPPDDTHFTLSFSPVPDERGEVGGVLVTAFEVTAQVAARRLSAERERLLSDLAVERARLVEVFRQAPAFLALLRGPEHVFEFANDAYRRLVGDRALTGRRLLEALPEVAGQGFVDLLDRVLQTGEPFVGREVPVRLSRSADGRLEERFVDFVYQPLVEGDGTRAGVVAHGTDVTEQVHARREVERLLDLSERSRAALEDTNAALEAARREAELANRSKSEFLAVMSHELRTPLNAIGGYAELLELGIRGPITTAQRDDLARIQASQRHLLGLINEVLNYAKLEAGSVQFAAERVALREAVAAVEPLVAPQFAARQVRFARAAAAPEVPLVARADADKVRQVLLNLLSNAVKFTAPGGQVVVECLAPAPGRVAVRVRDTGIGIPPHQLARVFEPFVQVNAGYTRTQEGTGLGLAISRDLARGMGGDLTAESVAGRGSAFTLVLPAADAPATDAPATDAGVPDGAGGG